MSGSIESKVKSVIARHFNIPPSKLRLDAAFIGDLGGDALDIIELAYALESAFNISIPLTIRDTLITPRDVIDYLCPSSCRT